MTGTASSTPRSVLELGPGHQISPPVSSKISDEAVQYAPPKEAQAQTRKRKSTANIIPRRRATTACKPCRLRKTKCDNAKPMCGFCVYHKARCTYDEDPDDTVVLDPTNQQILQRLDHITSLLESTKQGPTRGSSSVLGEQFASRDVGPGSEFLPDGNGHESSGRNYLESPFAKTACESLLRWPIFAGIISPEDAAIESFLLDSDAEYESNPIIADSSTRRWIREEDFVPLCKKFLRHVHTRNPILDGNTLINYAKEVREHGLGWDSPSCLVLIACALACFTSPWEPSKTTPGSTPDDRSPSQASSILAASVLEEDKATAEAYYLAAKKRIGLLQTSIIDMQCLFLAGIYEKYSLKPLRAWFYIQQTSGLLQARLLRNSRRTLRDDDQTHYLEQRLYWSCLKAECEFWPEIPLRPSGIQEFSYPDLFPSPPEESPPEVFSETRDEILGGHQNPEEQRSWFYYLAEISMRRTLNNMMLLLYKDGEQRWIADIDFFLRQYTSFDEQISLWYNHLPPPVRFGRAKEPDNELSFFLKGRFQGWQHAICRPLIYYTLHSPTERSSVTTLAQKGVDVCAEMIPDYSRHNRHGGIWFINRGIFTCAVLILAAVCSNGRLSPPNNWQALVSISLQTLERWAGEAPDISWMHSILSQMFIQVARHETLESTS